MVFVPAPLKSRSATPRTPSKLIETVVDQSSTLQRMGDATVRNGDSIDELRCAQDGGSIAWDRLDAPRESPRVQQHATELLSRRVDAAAMSPSGGLTGNLSR